VGKVMDVKEALEKLADETNKQLKSKAIIPGNNPNLSDIKLVVPTRSWGLNKLLGGGMPVGRVIEIFGDPSNGKSTLAEEIMIGFQQFPGLSILLDSEFGWDRSRAKAMGHNDDFSIYIQVHTLEQGIEAIDTFITRVRMKGKGIPNDWPIVIVWDTISNSSPESEFGADDDDSDDEGVIKKQGMMFKPRLLRQLERKWSVKLPETMCSLVFVSQTYEGPAKGKGAYAGKQQHTSGGGAIKFWASKRIKVWRAGNIDYPEDNSGIVVCANTIKDKLAPPNRQVDIPVMFKTGVHPGYELLNYLLDNDKSKALVYKDGKDIMINCLLDNGSPMATFKKDFEAVIDAYPQLMELMIMQADKVWRNTVGG
jgi:recombination protein RecA